MLASRVLPLERAVARVCQEAGARVARNVRLSDMIIDVPVSDDCRIEVVANGLSLGHGSQKEIDATIVSPVTGRRGAAWASCPARLSPSWGSPPQATPNVPRACARPSLPLVVVGIEVGRPVQH